MTEIISTPKISEILLEEFMNPLQISAYRLAMDIHVPASRILEILHDKRKITADTSIRLGRYFGVSDSYFLNLQSDIDIRNEKLKREDEWGHQKLITIIKRPVPKPNEVNRRFKGKLYLIMRTFLTILVSVMLLLISVSAWANRHHGENVCYCNVRLCDTIGCAWTVEHDFHQLYYCAAGAG